MLFAVKYFHIFPFNVQLHGGTLPHSTSKRKRGYYYCSLQFFHRVSSYSFLFGEVGSAVKVCPSGLNNLQKQQNVDIFNFINVLLSEVP